jgi:hypothetical protein
VFQEPASLLGLTHESMMQLQKNDSSQSERLKQALQLIEKAKAEAWLQIEKEAAEAEGSSKAAEIPAVQQVESEKDDTSEAKGSKE